MHKSRRIIALLTALIFLLSLAAPAFAKPAAADYREAIKRVTGVKAMIGYADGTFGENDTFTRAQAATVMARISGYEPKQAALTKSGFPDVANTHWASDAVAYAFKQGIIKGHPDGTFRPDGQVTYREMVTMLVRVLGFGPDVEAGLGWPFGYDVKGAELGLVSQVYAANPNAPAIRGEVALATAKAIFDIARADGTKIIYRVYNEQDPAILEAADNALIAYDTAPLTTLAQVVAAEALAKAATDAIAKVTDVAERTALAAKATSRAAKIAVAKAALTPLAVQSVNAINTKQVQVKFNKAVDKVTAETAANYTVGGAAFGKAVLQADNMTVIATMAGDTKLTNAGTAEIKVLKNVKAANNVALAADFTTTISAVDTTVPTVVGVKAVGARVLEITFSEPVYNGTNAAITPDQITIQSGIFSYIVNGAVADYANRTVTVTVGTNLLEGDLTIRVNAKGMSDPGAIRDFAGLVLVPTNLAHKYAIDTTVATASLSSVNMASKVAKVTFSKPVYGTNVRLFHSVNGVDAFGTPAVTILENAASTEWEFTFTNALPAGQLTFFLVNDTVSANQLSDLFGVKVPNRSFAFTVVADTTPPTVSTVTVNTNVSIDIKFSEAIDAAEAVKTANFGIVRPDGTALSFTPTLQGTDTVKLTAELVDNTTYTINVTAMKDVAGNAMTAAFSVQRTVGDNQHPTATAYVTDANNIYVVYSEPMNQADVTNKSNYLYKDVALAAADTVILVSPSKVNIKRAAGGVIAGDVVTIGPVKDLAGKTLVTTTTFSTAVTTTADALTFTAELTAVNKVRLTFTRPLAVFDVTDFTIGGGQWLAIESNTLNSSGNSVVVLVLATNQAANATPIITAGVSAKTRSTEGTAVTVGPVTASDKVAPTVSSVVFVSPTRIEVRFSEPLNNTLFAPSGVNGFSVAGSTTFTSAALLTPGTNSNAVILRGEGFTVNTDVAYNGTNGLRDVAGNTLAAFSRTDVLSVGGVTLGATAETTAGAAAVAEVGTTTVTAGATSAFNLIVNVADGTMNRDVIVAVAANDTATQVATKIAAALVADTVVAAGYTATSFGADVILTQKVPTSNVNLQVILK